MAAFVPIFAFLCDLLIVCRFAVPFAYRAFVVDESPEEMEGVGALFLAYASRSQKRLREIKVMEPGIRRQSEFRRYYALRRIYLKGMIFALGCIGEVTLWLIMRTP